MRAFLRYGLADPEDVATELGIVLYEVIELVRRYPTPPGALRKKGRLPVSRREQSNRRWLVVLRVRRSSPRSADAPLAGGRSSQCK
jgi:hypothetical protein